MWFEWRSSSYTRLTDNKLCIAPTPLLDLHDLKQMISKPDGGRIDSGLPTDERYGVDRFFDNTLCKALGFRAI